MTAVPSPAAADPIVRFEDVHILFNVRWHQPVWALRGLSFDVPRGSVMGLLGPNGAGKTTSISCLLSLLEPVSGSIWLGGERLPRRGSLRGPTCGVLLEDTRLPPFLTVRDALKCVGALRSVAGLAKELDRVVAQSRIEALLSRRVSALSKGQARRVGLAAALISDPPILVLDEPSAGLDAEARLEFEQLVLGLRDGHRTLLIASHLLGDIEATCTHLTVMREGRVVLSGEAAGILGNARRGQASNVHVDASAASALAAIGLAFEPSYYPELVRVKFDMPEEELFAALAHARIVPRRVEPHVSVQSVYLDAMRKGGAAA